MIHVWMDQVDLCLMWQVLILLKLVVLQGRIMVRVCCDIF